MPLIIWITGASGFSGRHLAKHLKASPEAIELVGLGRKRAARCCLDSYYAINLEDQSAVAGLAMTHPPDRVFHLAGRLPPAPAAKMWLSNVAGTLALFHAVARKPKRGLRILTVGSAAEYLAAKEKLTERHPSGGQTTYGRTKWAQTVLALACASELKLDVMAARTFNLIGPGLSPNLVAGSLCAQFSRPRARRVEIGDVRPFRDFVDVRDAVAAYARIVDRGEPGEIYNVCSGRATSIRTLARSFASLSGFRGTLQENPSRIRRGEIDRSCGDNTKLRGLGWEPSISLRQSISDMLTHARTG